MKRITAKQYAKSLYESLKEAKAEEVKGRIQNFLELLKRKKQLKILSKIFDNFVRIYQEEKGILTTEVITSQGLSPQLKETVKEWLEKYTKRQPKITELINPEIIGGVIIKFEDAVIDASLANNLKKLQKAMINDQ